MGGGMVMGEKLRSSDVVSSASLQSFSFKEIQKYQINLSEYLTITCQFLIHKLYRVTIKMKSNESIIKPCGLHKRSAAGLSLMIPF